MMCVVSYLFVDSSVHTILQWMGFAPDVSTMLSNFGNDITKAGTAYCGLQAKATNPSNGKTGVLFLSCKLSLANAFGLLLLKL